MLGLLSGHATGITHRLAHSVGDVMSDLDSVAPSGTKRAPSRPNGNGSRDPEQELLHALQAMRSGDFSVRMTGDHDGVDFSPLGRLLSVLRRPYDEQPEAEHYAELPPDWAGSLHLSCSS